MALELKFNVCVVNKCTQLEFTETTGVYNVTTNPTGWGAPNIELAEIVAATLTITSPSGTDYVINLFDQGFPSSNVDFSYIFNVGALTEIVDGKWTFVYTVTDSESNTYTKTVYNLFSCQADCCVHQMLVDLELTCDCCSKDTAYENYIKAWTFLQALKNAAECGDINSFNNLLKILEKLCKNNNCKTCK